MVTTQARVGSYNGVSTLKQTDTNPYNNTSWVIQSKRRHGAVAMVIAIIDFTAIILHRRCIKVCKSWVWAIVSLDFFFVTIRAILDSNFSRKREICFFFAKTLFSGIFAFHFKQRILRKPLIFVLSCIDINCYAQYSETSTSDEINSFALSFVSFDTIYHSHSYLGISFRSWEFSRSRFVFKRGARVTGIKNESQVIRTEWRMRKMHFPKGALRECISNLIYFFSLTFDLLVTA